MGELAALPNIGKVLEQQLHDVGIDTEAELRAVGSKQAWLRIYTIDPSACLHRLSALEGALRNMRKSELPAEVKADLKAFFQAQKETGC